MNWFNRIFRRKQSSPYESPVERRVAVTGACLLGIRDCVEREIERRHEGVAYLLGVVTDDLTLVVSAVRPEATTSSGSFHVDEISMARVVRVAANCKLQVVGQFHTHPSEAYHSEGDEQGANIAYDGYLSLVAPQYGRFLPKLTEAAAYQYSSKQGFLPVKISEISVVEGVST